ncbi:MAG TPA: DNA repair protein RecO [Candidatus Moranbacteria bacterium]|nr:DNA repair protein RecO [Candidatus Moranbacteria bacterium]
MEIKYHAIILNKFDVSETDRIYVGYTLEAGKISALAKGVRKSKAKLAGILEPITYAEVFIARNRGKGKIVGAICANNFSNIKNDLASLERVFYIFQIFNRLVTQEERDEKVFNLLLAYLEISEKLASLKDEDFKSNVLTLGFVFKLLQLLGYGIQTGKCVNCSTKIVAGENYFSAKRGGILCANCARAETGKIKISDSSIKLIRIFFQNKLENFSKIKISQETLNNLKVIANETLRWVDN